MTASEYHNSTCRTVHTIWGGKTRNQAEDKKLIRTWDIVQKLIIKREATRCERPVLIYCRVRNLLPKKIQVK